MARTLLCITLALYPCLFKPGYEASKLCLQNNYKIERKYGWNTKMLTNKDDNKA